MLMFDYWMLYSEQGIFGENVVLAGHTEVSNGGTFVLTPGEEQWEVLKAIMLQRGTRGASESNVTLGWGHVIEPPDRWYSNRNNGTGWGWYAGLFDQGLVYHYCKYARRNCTQILAREVMDWRPLPNAPEDASWGDSTVAKRIPWEQSILSNVSLARSFPFTRSLGFCKKFTVGKCRLPYTDFTHWTAGSKPWKRQFPTNRTVFRFWKKPTSAKALWFHMFFTLQDEWEERYPNSAWFQDIIPDG